MQLYPVASPALTAPSLWYGCFSTGPGLSLTKLQGNLEERDRLPTLQQYLRLSAQAFPVICVEKYSPSSSRSRKRRPKLIVHDNALWRAFKHPTTAPLNTERFGRYLENAIGARLIEGDWGIFYWRHRHHGADFVLIGPLKQRYAIEVKTEPTGLKRLRGVFEVYQLHPDFEPSLVSLYDQTVPSVKTFLSRYNPTSGAPLS